MKKKLLMILGLVGAGSFLNAQTITFNGQVPTDGDVITYEEVNTGSFGFCFVPEGSGPITDKLWDARKCENTETAIASKGQMQINYETASSTTFTSDYPKANFALSYSGVVTTPGYEYYRFSNDSIIRMGFTTNTENQLWYVDNNFDNTFPRYVFPINPGNSINSSYKGYNKSFGISGEDSVVIENGTYSATAQAVGSLILPGASFGALGEQFDDIVLMQINESFEIKVYCCGVSTAVLSFPLTDVYYAYFKEGVQEPLLIYYETTQPDAQGSPTTTTTMRYQPLDGYDPIDGVKEDYTYNAFTIFPNPTEGIVNITLRDENIENAQVKIYNVLGEEVKSLNEKLTFYNSIDISEFNAGVYYVKVMNNGKEGTQKVILK